MPTVSAADLCHKNFHIDIGQWKCAASNCEISEGESGKQPKLENKRQNDDAELEEREINQAKYIEECALASN